MLCRVLALLLCAALLPAATLAEAETYFALPQASAHAKAWTYPIALDILRDSEDLLRLVNRANPLETDYPPDDALHALVDCGVRKATYDQNPVRAVVQAALVAMFSAAKADGCNLVVKSAYRSYGGQAATYARYIKREGRDYGYVLPAGASEHQTGLAVDVLNPKWIDEPAMNARFAQTKEAQWMAENAHLYGFIIRYPDGKEEETGVKYEPWHLRYVGPEVAGYLHASGITLEAFEAEYRHEMAVYASQGGAL